MTMPQGKCARCGEPLTAVRLQRELAVVQPNQSIVGTQRNFVGQCPSHGEVFATFKIGNHWTLAEKKMKNRYSPATSKRIKGRLSQLDRAIFDRTLHGQRRPSEHEIKRWDRLAATPAPAPISERLGKQPK